MSEQLTVTTQNDLEIVGNTTDIYSITDWRTSTDANDNNPSYRFYGRNGQLDIEEMYLYTDTDCYYNNIVGINDEGLQWDTSVPTKVVNDNNPTSRNFGGISLVVVWTKKNSNTKLYYPIDYDV